MSARASSPRTQQACLQSAAGRWAGTGTGGGGGGGGGEGGAAGRRGAASATAEVETTSTLGRPTFQLTPLMWNAPPSPSRLSSDMDDKDSVRGALAVCDRAALNRVNEADLRQCALEAASTGCAASCKKVVDLVRGLLLLRCPGTDNGHWETGGNRRLRPVQPTTGSLLQKCALFLPHLPPLPPLTAAAPTTTPFSCRWASPAWMRWCAWAPATTLTMPQRRPPCAPCLPAAEYATSANAGRHGSGPALVT